MRTSRCFGVLARIRRLGLQLTVMLGVSTLAIGLVAGSELFGMRAGQPAADLLVIEDGVDMGERMGNARANRKVYIAADDAIERLRTWVQKQAAELQAEHEAIGGRWSVRALMLGGMICTFVSALMGWLIAKSVQEQLQSSPTVTWFTDSGDSRALLPLSGQAWADAGRTTARSLSADTLGGHRPASAHAAAIVLQPRPRPRHVLLKTSRV